MELDVTGQVVQRVTGRLHRFRKHMTKIIPYGPRSGHATTREIGQRLTQLNPDVKLDFINRVGDDEWRRMMDDIYGVKG